MKFEPVSRWALHISLVQQARELTAAVGTLTTKACLPAAAALLESVAGEAVAANCLNVSCVALRTV